MTRAKLVAIVDAYSSGHGLPHWFRANGFDCVHISSSSFAEHKYSKSFRPQDFLHCLRFEGDLAAPLQFLSDLGVQAVLGGSETGVLLADQLAASLPVVSNGLHRSAGRRDKSILNGILRECDLNAIAEQQVTTAEDALVWTNARGQWPVIVKPCASAGGDSVTLCNDPEELTRAVNAIIGKRNKIGIANAAAIVQEYVKGSVYSVNTVSCEGHHYVTNIWQYVKQGLLYDHEFLIPIHGELQSQLVDYAFAVLNAMEISYGPTHIEIICDSQGPKVVDFGARLHGCDSPVINRECTGIGQDELTADAFVNRDAFFRKTQKPYHVYKHLMTVDFISPLEGEVKSIEPFEKLKQLSSYHFLRLDISKGERLERTVDLFTSPGLVELVHRDFNELKVALKVIREMERNGLYDAVLQGCFQC
jgi:hypothetical protein